MTDRLIGGQAAWKENARAISTMLRARGMTDISVRQILSTDVIHAKMAELVIAARPGAKSATTPEIAKFIPRVWSVFEDVPSRISPSQKLEFVPSLGLGTFYTSGKTMRARAVKLGCNLGIADAVFFIEQQGLIPKELRKENYIVFPGTVLQDSDGDLYMPFLSYSQDSEQWEMKFFHLNNPWYCFGRFVHCK